jgi:tRNA threonylcarbamoyladenosine biosynthesis protein TsaB
MLTLAFDTSTLWGRFALAEDGEVLLYRPLNVSGSYADALLVVMQEMLAECGRTREELRAIAVTVGPGSFTGVRIGVATAKGLAWALNSQTGNCRLHAVTSLAAMAGALLAEHQEAELAVPVLDARRGEVYSSLYARDGGWVLPVLGDRARRPDAMWEELKAQVRDLNEPAYGGDGTELLLGQGSELRPELLHQGQPRLRRWTAGHPATAPALARAVSAGVQGLEAVHPFTLVPEYLRGSDAEIKRNLDLTPSAPSDDISAFRSEIPEAGDGQ